MPTRNTVVQEIAKLPPSAYYSMWRAVQPFDITKELVYSASPVVVLSYPVVEERVVLIEFTGLVCQLGPGSGGGTKNAMYKVMSRFTRFFSSSLAHVATVKSVESETDAGFDMTTQVNGNSIEIVGTPPSISDLWFFRATGQIIELPAPVPP